VPIYEYECGHCHFQFERKQRFDEEPVAICPKCQGKARRVIHSVPVIFKGSGFYTTDNRKNIPSQKAEEGMPAKDKREEK
jgi:putative FmdB family regulatory protein